MVKIGIYICSGDCFFTQGLRCVIRDQLLDRTIDRMFPTIFLLRNIRVVIGVGAHVDTTISMSANVSVDALETL